MLRCTQRLWRFATVEATRTFAVIGTRRPGGLRFAPVLGAKIAVK
jgi:hypothetical protein